MNSLPIFSNLDFDFTKDYLRVDEEDYNEINLYIEASKDYIREYTGFSDDILDSKKYYVVLALQLISTFYDNKTIEFDSNSKIFNVMMKLGSKVHL